jgi:predicted transcriptional regulator
MQAKQSGRLLVIDDGALVGIVTLKDVLAHLQLRQALAER